MDGHKALLIVGLGSSSVGFARAAKRRGLRAIGIDRNPNAFGSRTVDEQIVQSTNDSQVNPVLRRFDIQGVVCSTSRAAGFAASASIAAELGSPGPQANFFALDDKYALSQILGDLSPCTSLLGDATRSSGNIRKPRFGDGLVPPMETAGGEIWQERVEGQEYFVGGIASEDNSAPVVILRKAVNRSELHQSHLYSGRLRTEPGHPTRIESGDVSIDAVLERAWISVRERTNAQGLFLGIDCIISNSSSRAYVIDAGPLWDLGLEYLLPIVGIDLQAQLIGSLLGHSEAGVSQSEGLVQYGGEVHLAATARVVDGTPRLTAVHLSRTAS